MKTLSLRNGDAMPVLGLGTWKSARGEVLDAVKHALALGYRHIDCAAVYGNEAEVGQAIQESIDAGVVTRDQLWITSKLWNDAHAPADVGPALDETLTKLRLDYLDLYLVHWPVALQPGVVVPASAADLISLDELPLATTWAALERTVDAGKCRHIGVSNFSAAKLDALLDSARIQPEVNQVELHPYLQQPQLLASCQQRGVIVTAYSPLGSPDRPDMFRQADDPVLLQDAVLADIAKAHDASVAQIALAWAVARGTSVIPKSVSPTRLRENLQAADIELGDEDMARIAKLDRKRRYVGAGAWAIEGSPYTARNVWDE